MKLKLNPKLKKFIENIVNDILDRNGGWIFFLGRMFINCVCLYYIMKFVKSWIIFLFLDVGLTQDYTHTAITVAWAFGLIFFIWRVVNNE